MPLFYDRTGRFSPLLTVTLIGLAAPALWLGVRAAHGDFSGPAVQPFGAPPGLQAPGLEAPGLGAPGLEALGLEAPGLGAAGPGGSAGGGLAGEAAARPIFEAIHFTGDWAVRFLLLSLAVTPFRRLLHWTRLHLVRRRVGLAALAYAFGHFALYAFDQNFIAARIASEILLRVYLTIGFVGLVGLIALGATSTDGAVRRMGAQNWGRLHKTTYLIAGLALLHFAMQSKLDVTEPTLMWGLFLWAMGWRWLQARDRGVDLVRLIGLALAAGALTALSEFAWYGLATGVDPWRVLAANLNPDLPPRACWWVALFGLAAAASSLVGARRRGVPRARPGALAKRSA